MLWNRRRDHDSTSRSPGRVRPAAQVLATRAGDDTVLLDLRRGQYYTLNEVAGRVWALLEDGCAAPDIARRLATEYDAPVDAIAVDVEALLAGLAAASLVERAE